MPFPSIKTTNNTHHINTLYLWISTSACALQRNSSFVNAVHNSSSTGSLERDFAVCSNLIVINPHLHNFLLALTPHLEGTRLKCQFSGPTLSQTIRILCIHSASKFLWSLMIVTSSFYGPQLIGTFIPGECYISSYWNVEFKKSKMMESVWNNSHFYWSDPFGPFPVWSTNYTGLSNPYNFTSHYRLETFHKTVQIVCHITTYFRCYTKSRCCSIYKLTKYTQHNSQRTKPTLIACMHGITVVHSTFLPSARDLHFMYTLSYFVCHWVCVCEWVHMHVYIHINFILQLLYNYTWCVIQAIQGSVLYTNQ